MRKNAGTITWAFAHTAFCCVFVFAATLSAQVKPERTQGAPPDFGKEIQPLLAAHCLKCHGPEKQKGGLRLDTKAAAFEGGESGERGVVAGQTNESRLFQLVTSQDEDQRMPPEGDPLSAEQIDVLKRWIDGGAIWPESDAPTRPARSELVVTDEDRKHWSFRPLQAVAPPEVADKAWVRTPVDQFIRHAQEAKGLTPAATADARTLVRRLYFDLIGLPPQLKEENGKLKEKMLDVEIDASSFEPLVDALLASPRYRMQMEATELVDFSTESAATRELYGVDDKETRSYGSKCLMARRLVERGVRFVQVYSDGEWDAHSDLNGNHRGHCRATDRPIHALLSDLKRTGLIDSTLVMWGGEFGRMPVSQGNGGRDHNPNGFGMFMTGAGIKSGTSFGELDEIGYRAAVDRVSVHDLHATMLHLLGIDHKQLTYFHNGRRYRLTDVAGEVLHKILT